MKTLGPSPSSLTVDFYVKLKASILLLIRYQSASLSHQWIEHPNTPASHQHSHPCFAFTLHEHFVKHLLLVFSVVEFHILKIIPYYRNGCYFLKRYELYSNSQTKTHHLQKDVIDVLMSCPRLARLYAADYPLPFTTSMSSSHPPCAGLWPSLFLHFI